MSVLAARGDLGCRRQEIGQHAVLTHNPLHMTDTSRINIQTRGQSSRLDVTVEHLNRLHSVTAAYVLTETMCCFEVTLSTPSAGRLLTGTAPARVPLQARHGSFDWNRVDFNWALSLLSPVRQN